MNKQQKLKIALPVLFVMIIVVWLPVLTGGETRRDKEVRAASADAGHAAGESGEDLMALARSNHRKKRKTSFSAWGRNPFVMTEGPKISVLEGILWDPQNPKAIINGFILGIGEAASSGTIVDIQPDRVTIESQTGKKVYRLAP